MAESLDFGSLSIKDDITTSKGKQKVDPHIYGVVNNRRADEEHKEWKYVKVGFTERDTTTGSGNRMETVKKKIDRSLGEDKASVLFVLPQDKDDTRTKHELEKSIRNDIGY